MSFSKAETVEHHDPEYNLRIIISIPLRVIYKKEFDIWTSELATSNLLIEQKSSKQRRLKAELFTQGQEAFRLGCSFSDNYL